MARMFQRLARKVQPREFTASDGSRWRLRKLAAGDLLKHGGKGILGLMQVKEAVDKAEAERRKRPAGPVPDWANPEHPEYQQRRAEEHAEAQARAYRQLLSMPDQASDFFRSRDATVCAAVVSVWDDEAERWDPIQFVVDEDEAHQPDDLEDIAVRIEDGEDVVPRVWIEVLPDTVRNEIAALVQGVGGSQLERFRGGRDERDHGGSGGPEVRTDAA